MIRSVIVDDERKHRETTKMLLETYCPDVEILAEATDKKSVHQVLSEYKPDLVFLDINLGSFTAFDVLDDLSDQIDFKIVFITASEKYALEGYKYNAIDYLLKPIKVDHLRAVVDKVMQQHVSNETNEIILDELMQLYEGYISSIKISTPISSRINILKTCNILYCQNYENSTIFKMLDESEITLSKNLKYLEDNLQVKGFRKTHESFMVNVHHIERVLQNESLVLMRTNKKIPLSKEFRNSFQSR